MNKAGYDAPDETGLGAAAAEIRSGIVDLMVGSGAAID